MLQLWGMGLFFYGSDVYIFGWCVCDVGGAGVIRDHSGSAQSPCETSFLSPACFYIGCWIAGFGLLLSSPAVDGYRSYRKTSKKDND